MKRIGALAFDTQNNDLLIIASKNRKVKFFDTKSQKVLKIYQAYANMDAKQIIISPSHRYLMVIGGHGAYIWKMGESEQSDIINGSKIVGTIS